MDNLFIKYDCLDVYKVLLGLNEKYFKNSQEYPEQKLKYTSVIDVAYMIRKVKENKN